MKRLPARYTIRNHFLINVEMTLTTQSLYSKTWSHKSFDSIRHWITSVATEALFCLFLFGTIGSGKERYDISGHKRQTNDRHIDLQIKFSERTLCNMQSDYCRKCAMHLYPLSNCMQSYQFSPDVDRNRFILLCFLYTHTHSQQNYLLC